MLHVGRIDLVSDTQPYVVLVHLVYEDGKIFIHSANVRMKIECINAISRVCFDTDEFQVIMSNSNPCSFETKYRSVIAFGTDKILIGKDIKLRMLRKNVSKHVGTGDALSLKKVENYVSPAGSNVDMM